MNFFNGLFGGIGGLLGKKKDKDKDKFKGMNDSQLKKSAVSFREKLVDDYALPKLTSEEFRKRKGLVGLENMGNTCYINSTLQCLSNCEELTSYFLTGEWEKDVNIPNILGSEGKIAAEYARLLHSIWTDRGHRVYEPKHFKYTLERENQLVNL